MKSRGFKFEENQNSDDRHGEDRLFAATVLNVTTALADDLTSAGFGKLGVDDLFKAAIFKIDAQYIREAKADGTPLEVERLVQRKIGVARHR